MVHINALKVSRILQKEFYDDIKTVVTKFLLHSNNSQK